jgi:small subunit ribosomal protein S2
MEKLPGAIIIIDTAREGIAVAEARRLKIPTVAVVDTNSDPTLVDYPVAANDDAIRAIRIILQKLVDAIVAGRGGSPAPVSSPATAASDLSAVSE